MTEARNVEERYFATHDGEQLFYRHWPAEGQTRGAILLLHRGHEHSGRVAHLVDELGFGDFDFFAWDARGHGRSPGQRGYSPSYGTSVRDLQSFVEHLESSHGFAEQDMYVIAQSVGAVLAATWAHDYAPRIRGLTLASPAFKIKLYVPLARPALALMSGLFGNFFVNSYVKPRFLSHDPERISSYQEDPLITRPISVNILLGLHQAARRIVSDAHAIVQPVQLLISGSDYVVHYKPQHDFYERLGSTVKEKHVLDGFYHDTLGERDRAGAVDAIRTFILARFEEYSAPPDLRGADREGVTAEESRRLSQPLSLFSLLGAYWASVRLLLRVGGRLSSGIRLGHQTGFDSGSTLDYVYRNKAEGVPLLGTAIDRAYLNAIGWRGIRQRKIHLEELLADAMQRLAADNRPLRLLDIAAGHGRYVLDAVNAQPIKPESILLRDYSDINVRDGRALIEEKGLGSIARFEKGDAFDPESLSTVNPKPTICVVSGLYELFPDNDMVSRSLAGVAQAAEAGAYLIYTGQPWHPQLEFIARALTSHRQAQAWVMRRRSQAEMDQLVEAAGFRKLSQRVDEWGIFTVTLAQRVD